MLAKRPVLVSGLYSLQLLLVFRKHLIIGQLSFSLFFIGHPDTGSTFTETGLITESDRTVRVVHSSAIAGSQYDTAWMIHTLKYVRGKFSCQHFWHFKG